MKSTFIFGFLFFVFISHSTAQLFSEQTGITLTGVYESSGEWGDYDGDGHIDILIIGSTSVYETTLIYKNNGNNTFTEIVNHGIEDFRWGDAKWGDYDNDGDLDVIASGYVDDNTIGWATKLYENQGGIFSEASTEFAALITSSIDWGDYDKDGDLDILICGANSSATWKGNTSIYRNDGNNNFTKISADLFQTYLGSCKWGDFDDDGDLDILLSGRMSGHDYIKLYRNDEFDVFSEISILIEANERGDIDWGDYDNDGDLDILITGDAESGNISKIYRNDGAGTFTDIHAGLEGVDESANKWGDFDNDGDLDVLLSGRNNSSVEITKIYQNNGDHTFTDMQVAIDSVEEGSVDWGDYDSDGDLDILITGNSKNGKISKVYRNESVAANTSPSIPNGLASETIGQTVILKWNPSSDPEGASKGLSYNIRVGSTSGNIDNCTPMADFGTGKRLLPARGNVPNDTSITFSMNGLSVGTNYWAVQAIDQTFKGSAFSSEAMIMNIPPTSRFMVTDSLNSIDTAVVTYLGNASETASYEWNFDGANYIEGSGQGPYKVCWDTNGTKTLSLRVTENSMQSTISFKSTLVKVRFTEIDAGFNGNLAISLDWGDYDNDGDLDALVGTGGSGEKSRVFRNDGNYFTNLNLDLLEARNGTVNWVDFDNDNDLDIFISGWRYTTDRYESAYLYKNEGGNIFTLTDFSFTGLAYSSSDWGDYDNDGDLDLIICGENTNMGYWRPTLIYRNDDGKSFTQIETTVQGMDKGSVEWGDYDNDGDLDILISGGVNSTYYSKVYRNDGQNSFTDLHVLDGINYSSANWGDYDSDGDLDILLVGGYNTDYNAFIYRNDGNNTFTNVPHNIEPVSYGFADWGDYDNDGDLDIIISGTGVIEGYADEYTTIYQNNDGVFTNTHIDLFDVQSGQNIWGDYDADGDLDILLTGDYNSDFYIKLYRNDGQIINNAPTVPTNLQSQIISDSAIFSWNASTDTETAKQSLTYNLRVGSSAGGFDKLSPASNPANGSRKLSAFGNAQLDTSFTMSLDGLAVGTNYWSVQTIDNGFKGSAFASEGMLIDVPPTSSFRIIDSSYSCDTVIVSYCGNASTAGTYNWDFDNANYIEGSGRGPYKVLWDTVGTKTIILTVTEEGITSASSQKNINIFTGFSKTNLGLYLKDTDNSAIADFDNDGDLDLIIDEGYKKTIKLIRNDGSSFSELPGTFTDNQYSEYSIGDSDNDNDADILVSGEDEQVLFQNHSSFSFQKYNPGYSSSVAKRKSQFCDLDNDGDLDIIVVGNGTHTYSAIFINSGNNSFSELEIDLPSVSYGEIATGDIDLDMDNDIIISGTIGGTTKTIALRNDGNNSFTTIETSIVGARWANISLGDYDADGDLDVFLSANYYDLDDYSLIYRNDLNFTFTDINVNLNITDIIYGTWLDINNDGLLDILQQSNEQMYFYRNIGNDTFEPTLHSFPDHDGFKTSIGDFNKDNSIDILYSYGPTNNNFYDTLQLLTNKANIQNTPPTAPENLESSIFGNNVQLQWDKATDHETPQAGLTYNIRAGTSPGGSDLVSGMSNNNGLRLVTAWGNVGHNTKWTLDITRILPADSIYFSVQTIDNSFIGSDWSEEKAIKIEAFRANFLFDTACAGNATHFYDTSIANGAGITQWLWDFGDGTIDTIQHPEHEYETAGTYNVQLTVGNNLFSNSISKEVTVKPSPAPNFTSDIICQGNKTNITNTSITDEVTISSWYWDFGDNVTSSEQHPLQHGYINADTFNIMLKIKALNGCSDSITKPAIVAEYPKASISTTGKTSFCKNDSSLLQVAFNPSYLYSWTNSGSDLINGDTNIYFAKLSGNYQIDVINPIGNCLSSDNIEISTNSNPSAPAINLNGFASTFCSGDSAHLSVTANSHYSYEWFRGKYSTGFTSNSVMAKSSGNYGIKITDTESGCSNTSSDSVLITVNSAPDLPIINQGSNITLCNGQNIKLTTNAISGLEYQWLRDNSPEESIFPDTLLVATNGKYEVRATGSNNCYSVSPPISVKVSSEIPTPITEITGETILCSGDSVIVKSSIDDALNVHWFNNYTYYSDKQTITIKSNATLKHIFQHSNGCWSDTSEVLNIEFVASPKQDIIISSDNTTFCQGKTITLKVKEVNGIEYNWYNGTIDLNKHSNELQVEESGEYYVELVNNGDKLTCTTQVPAQTISVLPYPAIPIIENADTLTICPGEEVTIELENINQNLQYNWFYYGILKATGEDFKKELYDDGTYYVEASNGSCSSPKDSVEIELKTQLPKPQITVFGPNVWYMGVNNNTASGYRWYYNGDPLDNENRHMLLAGQNLGTYYAEITDGSGCWVKSNEIELPTNNYKSAVEFTLPTRIDIFPNPTTNGVNIELYGSDTGSTELNLYSSDGRLILSYSFEKKNIRELFFIDLHNYPAGSYFLTVKHGKNITNELIIKAKE